MIMLSERNEAPPAIMSVFLDRIDSGVEELEEKVKSEK